MINWAELQFEQVVKMPEEYAVLDLSDGKWESSEMDFAVGKYDELRPGMYNTDIFEGKRFLHVGIDIGGPVGTECMAFMDGEISHLGYNPEPGDYGNVLITKHGIGESDLWALYGHLDSKSLEGKFAGKKILAGEVIGWFGDSRENGGWEPHQHFQLSLVEPTTHDLPGVVAPEDRERSLKKYPDPRLVLGPIY